MAQEPAVTVIKQCGCVWFYTMPLSTIPLGSALDEMADTASLEGQLDASDYTDEQQAQNEPTRDDASVTFSAHTGESWSALFSILWCTLSVIVLAQTLAPLSWHLFCKFLRFSPLFITLLVLILVFSLGFEAWIALCRFVAFIPDVFVSRVGVLGRCQ